MKKTIGIIWGIICAVVLIVFGMYVTDRILMKNDKPVLFSTWGYSYVPPINLPEKEIESAIIEYVENKGDKEEKYDNEKTFASMRVYLIEEKEEFTKFNIYAWVLEERAYLENNEIKQSSGSSIPHKFVVEKIDGKFVVTNVRIPRDGSYYADDIKDIFPTSVRYNMDEIHTDGTIDELELEVKQKAEDYFEKIK